MITKEAILLDQKTLSHNKSLLPFIYTDLLAEYAGDNKIVCFHFWNMTNQVILGMKDTRVAFLDNGVHSIKENGYQVVVRNSGGLAVVADQGILNFSIVLPQPDSKYSFSIDQGYELMKHIIEEALVEFDISIDAFEVTDSYCPGDFDLSIHGKKFAGISQRRIKNGIGIMIYLSVCGNQAKRGEIVREFYQKSLGNQFGTDGFPPVNPDSMANLSDLLKIDFTVDQIKERISTVLTTQYHFSDDNETHLQTFLNSDDFTVKFEKQNERMKQRNQVIDWSEDN